MRPAPRVIGGATVVCYTPIDGRHRPTGGCRHVVAGAPVGPLAGLAICRYADGDGFYLFGCDVAWRVMTDTWHPSVEEARAQAEFEYVGIMATWQQPA